MYNSPFFESTAEQAIEVLCNFIKKETVLDSSSLSCLVWALVNRPFSEPDRLKYANHIHSAIVKQLSR